MRSLEGMKNVILRSVTHKNIQKVHSKPLRVLDYLIINDSKNQKPRINKNFQQEISCHPGTLCYQVNSIKSTFYLVAKLQKLSQRLRFIGIMICKADDAFGDR